MNSNWFPHTDFRALLSQMNRRQLIRGAGTVAGAAALSSAMPKISHADDTLNLLCWPGHADPAVVKPFEDKYHVKVVAKEYVGGEAMLALISQSPPGACRLPSPWCGCGLPILIRIWRRRPGILGPPVGPPCAMSSYRSAVRQLSRRYS